MDRFEVVIAGAVAKYGGKSLIEAGRFLEQASIEDK